MRAPQDLLLPCSPPSSPPEWRARNRAIPARRRTATCPIRTARWRIGPRRRGPGIPVNAVAVDPNNNLWAVDRCETDDCVPVIELGPDGKTLKNFGAGLFVEPHQAAIDKDGNLWVADASAEGRERHAGDEARSRRPRAPEARQARPGRWRRPASTSSIRRPASPSPPMATSTSAKAMARPSPTTRASWCSPRTANSSRPSAPAAAAMGRLRSPHALAFDSQDHLYVADRGNSRVVVFDKDGKFLAAWKQFGRPSGIAIDKNDMLYVVDSQSSDNPGAANYNPGCRRGIRVGSVKDGKVMYYIPPPCRPIRRCSRRSASWSMATARSTRRPTTRRTSRNT